MSGSPRVTEVRLTKDYRFMYEHFVIATQNDLFLFLERNGEVVDALKFGFSIFKYGAPNDEARGGHPLSKYGLGFYGLYYVEGSPWIQELMTSNRVHPRHSDAMYSNRRHYVACFKDVTLDVICTEMQEAQISVAEIGAIVSQQLGHLEA
jgi:hypothetical protein